jgi:hypothetical protein
MRPFLFKDRDKDQVKLVQKCAFSFELLFGLRALDNEIDDKVADPWSMSDKALREITLYRD